MQSRKSTKLVVTHSERATFNACRKKWDLVYQERLRTIVGSRPLEWGVMLHAGIEAGYRAAYLLDSPGAAHEEYLLAVASCSTLELQRSRLARAQRGAVAELTLLVAEYRSRIASVAWSLPEAEALEADAEKLLEVGSWTLSHFFDRTRHDLARLVPLAFELAFEVPAPDSRGRPSALWYTGKIDAVWWDPDSGQVIVDDHKTTDGDATATGVERRIQLDPQMSGYLVALRYLARRGDLRPLDGSTVDPERLAAGVRGWCRYNLVRRSAPRAPATNKDGTVSVAAVETTGALYLAALQAQIENTGKSINEKQAAILERLQSQTDRWFSRQEFARTEEDARAWLLDLRSDVKVLRLAMAQPALRTRNPGNCTFANSMPCAYRKVCLHDSPETRAGFRIAETAHEEVTKDGDGRTVGGAEQATGTEKGGATSGQTQGPEVGF